MNQFKVSYKYREADFGQAKRVWASDFQIVTASNADDAKLQFEKNWSSSGDFKISSVEKCGVQ